MRGEWSSRLCAAAFTNSEEDGRVVSRFVKQFPQANKSLLGVWLSVGVRSLRVERALPASLASVCPRTLALHLLERLLWHTRRRHSGRATRALGSEASQ